MAVSRSVSEATTAQGPTGQTSPSRSAQQETDWHDLSPLVTICTTKSNIHKFYVLPTQCIYVFCGSENKEQLFHHTELTVFECHALIYSVMQSRTTIFRNSCKYTANETAVTPTNQDIQQHRFTLQMLIIRLNRSSQSNRAPYEETS